MYEASDLPAQSPYDDSDAELEEARLAIACLMPIGVSVGAGERQDEYADFALTGTPVPEKARLREIVAAGLTARYTVHSVWKKQASEDYPRPVPMKTRVVRRHAFLRDLTVQRPLRRRFLQALLLALISFLLFNLYDTAENFS